MQGLYFVIVEAFQDKSVEKILSCFQIIFLKPLSEFTVAIKSVYSR
jgi:hypothetical protein